jgi:hypothetical protein
MAEDIGFTNLHRLARLSIKNTIGKDGVQNAERKLLGVEIRVVAGLPAFGAATLIIIIIAC